MRSIDTYMKGVSFDHFKIHPNNPSSGYLVGANAQNFGGGQFNYGFSPNLGGGGRSANEWVEDNGQILDRAGELACWIFPDRCPGNDNAGPAPQPVVIEKERDNTVLYVIAGVVTILLLILIFKK